VSIASGTLLCSLLQKLKLNDGVNPRFEQSNEGFLVPKYTLAVLKPQNSPIESNFSVNAHKVCLVVSMSSWDILNPGFK